MPAIVEASSFAVSTSIGESFAATRSESFTAFSACSSVGAMSAR
jgi:hypothetical protein